MAIAETDILTCVMGNGKGYRRDLSELLTLLAVQVNTDILRALPVKLSIQKHTTAAVIV